MDVIEIQKRAKAQGLTGLDGMSKGDMIRATQIAEGSRGCYDNIWRHEYLEYECCWREGCHTPNQE
jgi:hypothetical protein